MSSSVCPGRASAVMLALALCLPLTTSSCSMFVPATQAVVITASDSEADIYVDGQHVGKGTVTVDLIRKKSHAVMGQVGDRSTAVSIGTKISAVGVMDIIGGFLFLVPFIGIAGPGFRDLDQTTVALAIPPPRN